MASTRVYIGRLARDATKRDLERLFKNYGDIREINVKTGFGFVEFSDERDAKDVVYDFHGKSFLGERLIVEIARGARRNDERRNNGNDRRRSHYRLIVENIASGTNWQDLKDMMRKAGEVTFADISRDRPTEGIVEFAVRDDMEYALKKLNDRELNGQRVTLREDTGRNERSSGRSSTRRSRSQSKSRSRSPPRRRRRSPSESRSRSPPRRRRRSPSQSRSRSASRSRSPPRKREKRDSSDREDSRDRRRNKSESRSRSRSPAKSAGSAQSPARSPAQSPTRSEGSYPFQSLKLIAKTAITPANNAIKSSPLPTRDAVSTVEHVLTYIDTSAIDFTVKRKSSGIPNAGLGVYLHGSTQKKGSIVCFYPGTLYMPSEPILFVSIANQYILKCVDGIYVDGKPKGLSKRVYKSLYRRENWPGAIQISDWTWMSKDDRKLSNPLAIGQYVNNGTSTHKANVCYQEIDLPATFPHKLRRLIPNMYWDAYQNPLANEMRVVALVALRDIQDGEELLSTYMDVV
ncbi:hypothetical protein MAM1_0512c10797 [Mucor ambiguus]|uniref:RRM domain-containing protein n=2 Tax=Mucor TaxID=4830 RepID=A0A0C9N952_9FUNG|nr:hypothetical protein MAM1_0512c10797 [Mucor ambiguus]